MKLAVYSKNKLKDNPIKLSLTADLKSLGNDVVELDDISYIQGYDCLLVFGGDGTMLYSATRANCPILGINLGNVGFLAQYEPNATAKDIVRAIENATYQSKPLLQTRVGSQELLALNDIVIRTISSRPIFLSVKANGVFVDRYHADGLIVSTPTGSTAYSLSAGGPIVSPDVDAIIINPICAHSLHSRPLIVSGDTSIDVEIEGENSVLIADGREQLDLKTTSQMQISKSSKVAKFVYDGNNFYNKLLEKMNKWGVTN